MQIQGGEIIVKKEYNMLRNRDRIGIDIFDKRTEKFVETHRYLLGEKMQNVEIGQRMMRNGVGIGLRTYLEIFCSAILKRKT